MRLLVLLAVLLLGACKEETVQLPPPVRLSAEALGHYCQMDVAEHAGPKAQIHLAGLPMPIWFAQVRDGVAHLKSGERSHDVRAFYVNDMGAAPSWERPGAGNWIDGSRAYFVVGSDALGGMGAPELVPFAREQDARAFAARGGQIKRLQEITAAEVLAPVELRQSELVAQ